MYTDEGGFAAAAAMMHRLMVAGLKVPASKDGERSRKMEGRREFDLGRKDAIF